MNSIPPEAMFFPRLQTGDVVCCWGTDRVSRMISLMTCSLLPPWSLAWGPSHMAIIHREPGNERCWYESTTMGTGHQGAQSGLIAERWRAYRGRCVILRPTMILSPEQHDRMGIELRKMLSQKISYDLAGALLSGTRLLRYLVPSSGKQLFCSELVARVLQVGGLMNWGSPAGYSPGRLSRELLKSGAFERVPCPVAEE